LQNGDVRGKNLHQTKVTKKFAEQSFQYKMMLSQKWMHL